MEEKKSAFASKTMWSNLLLGLAGLLAAAWPASVDFIGADKLQSALLVLFPLVNMLLRMVSKDKLYLSE